MNRHRDFVMETSAPLLPPTMAPMAVGQLATTVRRSLRVAPESRSVVRHRHWREESLNLEDALATLLLEKLR